MALTASRKLANPRPRSRRRVAWGTALAAAASVFALTTPAMASGTAVAPGWYGGQPMSLDACGKPVKLAAGSDGKPMNAFICVTKTGTKRAQAVIVFDNFSASSATAVGKLRARAVDSNDNVINGPYYTCGGKTLKPKSRLYCAGQNTQFSSPLGLVGFADGTATVNGYGGGIGGGSVSIT